MADRRCVVAICHNLPYVLRETTQSLMALGWSNRVAEACAAHGFSQIAHAWYFRSPLVSCLRDAALLDAHQAGFSHLLFLDADMIFPDDLLVRMLRHHDRGIVSGLYVQKQAPYRPIALRDGIEQDGVMWYQHDLGPFDGSLRPQQVVGMGCTLVPLSVLDAIGPRPWFEYQHDANGWPTVSEDVPFCQRAGAAGVGIWLDPTVKCGHCRTEVKTDLHWTRYAQSIAASETAGMQVKVTHGHHDAQGDHRSISGDLRRGDARSPSDASPVLA